MARKPKPWYWEARKAWYVQLDRKQVKLHEDKQEAERKFQRLMSNAGKPVEGEHVTPDEGAHITVEVIVHLVTLTDGEREQWEAWWRGVIGRRLNSEAEPTNRA